MENTKSKYWSLPIWVIYNDNEIDFIKKYYKKLNSLPLLVQEDIKLWLSHILEKYWLNYNEVFFLTKYQIWCIITNIINNKTNENQTTMLNES